MILADFERVLVAGECASDSSNVVKAFGCPGDLGGEPLDGDLGGEPFGGVLAEVRRTTGDSDAFTAATVVDDFWGTAFFFDAFTEATSTTLRPVVVKFWPRGGLRALPSMRGGGSLALSRSVLSPRFARGGAADELLDFFFATEAEVGLVAVRFLMLSTC